MQTTTSCAATVKRTGKICGRKALDNGFCGYHQSAARPSSSVDFQANNSLEISVPQSSETARAPTSAVPPTCVLSPAENSLVPAPDPGGVYADNSVEISTPVPDVEMFVPNSPVQSLPAHLKAGNSLWNTLPFARVEQALPYASRVLRRFNVADFRFIL